MRQPPRLRINDQEQECYRQEHQCYTSPLAVPTSLSPPTIDTEGEGPSAGPAQTTEDHLYSKKTKTSYKGQVTRALAFIAAQTEPGWKDAFTKISSLTPTVLMAYVASKCQDREGEGLSYKTAEGIKSGLKHYFKTELGCLTDSWSCDSDGNCTGNPVHEETFEHYLQSLKNRDGRASTSRKSLAMSHSDMVALMDYLQDPATIADIELGQTTDTGWPFFTIALTFRKSNQTDVSKVNVYQIHPLPGYEAICCYTKLKAWLQWMERKNGKKLSPEDYVFLALDIQGRINFQEALSQTRVQGWLDQLTSQIGPLARRNGRFTTHCFRRGGAQFRFMFAKEKWSLKAVKWWGGWSEGEGTGAIMRYLMEEVAHYEDGFSDMLSPSRQDSRHAVFMGDTGTFNAAPITQYSLDVSLQSLKEAISVEMNHRSSIQEQELNQRQEVANKALIDLISAVMASNKALQESLIAAVGGLGAPQRHQSLQGQQGHQQRELAPIQAHQQREPALIQAPAPARLVRPIPAVFAPAPAHTPARRQPQDWTGVMRKTDPAKYSQRKLIAKEFNRVGRSEANMNEIHGEHAKSIRYLIASIRWGNSRRIPEAANKKEEGKGVAVDEDEDVDEVELDEEDDSEA
ncbi:hypothetical protein EC991_007995 [Linnemannia zychae]|nr:hypothetical protein EC991_007995 [Linnemannia zychae]